MLRNKTDVVMSRVGVQEHCSADCQEELKKSILGSFHGSTSPC